MVINMKRVLVLYAKELSGHHKAALALSEAFARLLPDAEVRCVRVEDFLNPIVSRFFAQTYMLTIKHIPSLWEWLYDNEVIKRYVKSVKSWNLFLANARLFRYLKRWPPDLIACTQAVPCEMLAILKQRGKIDIPILAVPTDFHVHSYWISDLVDRYCVATEKSALDLAARGVPLERITVTGIPISNAFRQHVDVAACRLSLGLDNVRPVVVLMGGGRGLIPFHAILRRLLRFRDSVQIVPILGSGKKYRRVRWQANRHEESIYILEYVDNVHEIMTLADVVVSKPGGMTSSEILAKRVPFVIANPLPGQEKRNQVFLTAENAALLALDPRDAARKVQEILWTPGVSARLKSSCERLARPDAADRAVMEGMKLLGYGFEEYHAADKRG